MKVKVRIYENWIPYENFESDSTGLLAKLRKRFKRSGQMKVTEDSKTAVRVTIGAFTIFIYPDRSLFDALGGSRYE